MDILRSYRMIQIRKKEKRMNIIQTFLNDEVNRKWINKIISKSISPLNKRYFGEGDLVDMLKLDVINAASYLQDIKEECFSVAIFNEHEILNFVLEFSDFEKGKPFSVRLKLFFDESPFKKDILVSYKNIKERFFKDKKNAEKLYSTALNQYNVEDKIFYLQKSLKIAPWGSVIAIKIIQALILIKSGEILGKSKYDQEKEKQTKNIIKK